MTVSDRIGLQPETSDAMHAAAVKRAQSHSRVLEALARAGATEETIRRVKEAHNRTSVPVTRSGSSHDQARSSAPVGRVVVESSRSGGGGGGSSHSYQAEASSHNSFDTDRSKTNGHGQANLERRASDAYSQAPSSRTKNIRSGVQGVAGIGAHLERMSTGEHMIVVVKEGGAAYKAGILTGSIIRAVNGLDVSGDDITELRDMIVGDPGSIIVLSIQPPGAHISYVEDIAMVRGDTLTTPSFLNSNYEPTANEVENMFRYHDEERAKSSNEGLIGWIGGMCFGPRKISRRDRSSEHIPRAVPVATEHSLEEAKTSAPVQRPATFPVVSSTEGDEELDEGIVRVRRQTDQTAKLLEGLVRDAKAFQESQDLMLSSGGRRGVSDDRLLSVNNHPVLLYASEESEEPETLRHSLPEEGKQLLWENLRDLEYTVKHLDNPGVVREANEDTAAPAAPPQQQAKPTLPPVEEKKPEKKPEKKKEEKPEIVEVAKQLPPAPAPAAPKEASPPKVAPATSSPAPSPAKPEKLTLGGKVLRVKVIEARDIPKMDVLTGSADPFVVLHLGDKESKTRVVKHSLTPVWDEEFSFPLELESGGPECLRVIMQDWNLVQSAHLIGEANVLLRDIQVDVGGSSGSIWLELFRIDASTKNRENAGMIRMELLCDAPARILDLLPEDWSQHWSKTKNRPYYSHRKTGETRWSRPSSTTVPSPVKAAPSATPLPATDKVRETSALPTPTNNFKDLS